MPVHPMTLHGGTKILVTVEPTAADGADASDAVLNIPIMRNGGLDYLSRTDIGYTTDLPAASLADTEHTLGAGYTVPENDTIQIGGGTYFMSVENDTA